MTARTTRVVALAGAALTYAVLLSVAAGVGAEVDPADQRAYDELGAWYANGELHVGNHTVPTDGHPVSIEIGYTSEGALVFDDGYRLDQAGPPDEDQATLTLVTPSGDVRAVTGPDIPRLDRLPATDPTLPYAAYVREIDGTDTSEIVVLDVRDGSEQVVGDPYDSGWSPLVLSPDLLTYPGNSSKQIRWRTGEVVPMPGGASPWPWEVGNTAFLSIDHDAKVARVLDRTSGHEHAAVPLSEPADYFLMLSVDGRWLAEYITGGVLVHDLTTGATTSFVGDQARGIKGWTPDGHMITDSIGGEVMICDPASGRCEGTGAAVRPYQIWAAPVGAFSSSTG